MNGEPTLTSSFEQATAELEGGRTEAAISAFEALADRGVSHPDVSFNRGVAYWKRAHTPSAKAGDLGQAVAGFRETLELRRDDEAAQTLIDGTRLEIAAHQSHRVDAQQLTLAEPLYIQALQAIPEGVPLGFTLVGGVLVLLAIGLTLKANLRARGLALLILGGLIWLVGSSLFAMETAWIHGARYAVVVVPLAEARDHLARKQRGFPPLPEGTLARVVEQRGNLVEASLGSERVWLLGSDLRILQSPKDH